MTAIEAVRKADVLRPNDWPESIKMSWVDHLEADFKALTHKEHKKKHIDMYDWHECQCDDELTVPDPLSECYVLYCMAMIDNANADSGLYANDMALANEAIQAAKDDYYRRNHKYVRNWRTV